MAALCAAAFICLTGPLADTAGAAPLELLFVGNSYTHRLGGVPYVVRDLAVAAGFEEPYVAMRTTGGASLTDNFASSYVLSTVDERNWDWVVLQDYPTGPTHYDGGYPDNTITAFMDASRDFDTRIDNSNTAHGWSSQIMFFETWAHEPGTNLDNGLPAYPVEFADPAAMMAELRTNYNAIGAELGMPVAPVGDVWEEAYNSIASFPSLDLYADDSHPNALGIYLTSLVFLKMMYNVPDTTGLPYQNLGGKNYEGYVSVTAAQAAFVQGIADAVVPEPTSVVILLGLGAVSFGRRRRT